MFTLFGKKTVATIAAAFTAKPLATALGARTPSSTVTKNSLSPNTIRKKCLDCRAEALHEAQINSEPRTLRLGKR